MRCEAKTKKGRRCKASSVKGKRTCLFHNKTAPNKPVRSDYFAYLDRKYR
jgi:hypothetical protein